MQTRTPHCPFALRFDQIHTGIEVVVLKVDGTGILSFDGADVTVDAFGQLTTTPYSRGGYNGGFKVEIREYFSRAYSHVYDARTLGLLPEVKATGWCTHFTQDHIDQGIYTSTEVHQGRECPNFYKEVTWSDTFVVKLKDAHRVLGCKPWETRKLLTDHLREMQEIRERLHQEDMEFEETLRQQQELEDRLWEEGSLD